MMNPGFVDNAFRPLDLGNFPPWNIIVTVAGGETRYINIPYPVGNNVIGLPLGFDVPQVIAGHYEMLLRMVQGMRDFIIGIVRDLAQCQLDAARFRQDADRFCKNANHYFYELQELKLKMGDNKVVSQVVTAPVSSPKKRKLGTVSSPKKKKLGTVSSSRKRKLGTVSSSRKRKMGTEESSLSETQAVCVEKPEHLLPPKSNDRPSIPGLLVQKSVKKEKMDELDDLPRREDVPSSAVLVCSDVQTEKVEFVAGVVPVGQCVDASTLCTSAHIQSTALRISNSIDITPPLIASANVSGQGEDEGFEYAESLKSDDLLLTTLKHSQGEDVPTDVQFENVESDAGVEPVVEPVDGTMISTPTDCQTVDSATLPIPTPPPVDSTSVSGQGEDEGFEDVENLKLDGLPDVKRSGSEDVPTSASLICSDVQPEQVASDAGALVVWEPVDATMTSTSANCQTDCTALTIYAPTDITAPLSISTSASNIEEDEWFENVDNFRIPNVYADLYKKIFSIYGHMATKKVIKSNDDILVVCVTSLMKIVSAMETIRGVDLSVKLIESWEGDIGDAETLQFNIKWLRQIFNALKNSWKSSFKIDKEVETLEQVLDATQVEYVGLWSRKDELESELLKVKMDIRKFEARISSEREAIEVKIAEKNLFLFKPVLGNLFNLEITN